MYGDKDAFVTYHESRGRTIPGTWDDDFINASLLVASEWIDGVYGTLFPGIQTNGFTQGDQWPRMGAVTNTSPPHVFANNEIPERVEFATYEAAWRQGNKPGTLEPDYVPGKYSSVNISGAVAVQYADVDAHDLQIQIAAVDRLLWPLLNPDFTLSGSSGKVGR